MPLTGPMRFILSRESVTSLPGIFIVAGSHSIVPRADKTPRAEGRPDNPVGSRRGREAYAAGIAAYERGDWREARRTLSEARAGDPRKACRENAAEILRALELDRFAIRLAAALALALAAIALAFIF
jgi:hypothetical protein